MARVWRIGWLLGALVLVACSRRTAASSASTSSPTRLPAPPASELILLAGHESSQATARYLPLQLSSVDPTRLSTLAPRERPALRLADTSVRAANGSWAPAYDALAAHEKTRWVYAAAAGDGYELRLEGWDEAGAAPSRSVALGPLCPSALALAEGNALVGSARGLGYVSLDEAQPHYRELVAHGGARAKPYDFFVRSAERVLAVDDEVEPRFADWLELSPRGVSFLQTFELPGVINGRYRAGALRRDGPNAFTLLAIVPFGILSGNGQLLASLSLSAQGATPGPSSTLNGSHSEGEELVSRAHPADAPALWAGAELTSWTGIALLADEHRLLLAAGTRGLWSVPLPLPATGKPAVSRAPGLSHCSDVVVRGKLVLALEQRADGASELHVLRWAGGELGLVHSRRLPGAFQRFVQ